MAKDGNLLRISQGGGGGGSDTSDTKRHQNA